MIYYYAIGKILCIFHCKPSTVFLFSANTAIISFKISILKIKVKCKYNKTPRYDKRLKPFCCQICFITAFDGAVQYW